MLIFVNRAVGSIKILRWIGVLLLVFLGLFALGMISPWRGLMWTTGGVILVAMFMILYANKAVVSEKPDPADTPTPAKPHESEDGALTLNENQPVEQEPQVEASADAPVEQHVAPFIIDVQPDPKPDQAHCPYCARALAQDYAFCPGCGHDTREVYRCEQCGHIQVIPAEANIKYCVQCGTQITEGSGRGE